MLAAPGWQADVKGFRARVFCRNGETLKTVLSNDNKLQISFRHERFTMQARKEKHCDPVQTSTSIRSRLLEDRRPVSKQ